MLRSLHSTFGPSLEILIFPSDEFGKQELPTEQIPDFVVGKGLPVNAPGCRLMAKVQTNGPETHPIWALAKEAFPGDVKWNFDGVFLFDKEGTPVARTNVKKPPTEVEIRSLL